MSIVEFVAARIKEFRTTFGETGLSQEALARSLGVATNTICRWETATYKPSLEDIEKLSRFFGKSLADFFPPSQAESERDGKVAALLRAAKELPAEDLVELQRYAEFRRARSLYGGGRPSPGRRRKDGNANKV